MNGDDVAKYARENLLSYCVAQNPNYVIPNHIKVIAKVLERVERGELKRVIITVPPRHGKSMLCSQFFPAWFLGKNPEKYIITATYGQDLSSDFGRKVKAQMQDRLFQTIFPECQLLHDTQSANRMGTKQGGSYFAVGAGGSITGRGAHLLLIDDPIKDREEAESPTMRQKVVDWYTSTAYTRLMPGGVVVVIMARWHANDFVSWLLEEAAHENWHKIDLPALSEDNEPLWPEKYSLEDLKKIQLNNSYDWASLYQQKPISTISQIFQPTWIIPGMPQSDRLYKLTFVDPAISQKTTADETAITTIAFDEYFGLYHEIETVSGRWSYDDIKSNIKAVLARQKPDQLHVENVQAQDWLVQDLNADGIPAQGFSPDQDKIRKGMSVQDMFSTGLVRVNHPQTQKQLLHFQNVKLMNDCADALVSGLLILKRMNLVRIDHFKTSPYEIRALTPADVMKDQTHDLAKIFKNMIG